MCDWTMARWVRWKAILSHHLMVKLVHTVHVETVVNSNLEFHAQLTFIISILSAANAIWPMCTALSEQHHIFAVIYPQTEVSASLEGRFSLIEFQFLRCCTSIVLLAVAVLTAMVLCHASSNSPKGLCCCRGCPYEWCGPCLEVLGKPLDHILPMVLLSAIQSCTSVHLHLADMAIVTLTTTVYLYTTKCRLAKYSTCRIRVVD